MQHHGLHFKLFLDSPQVENSEGILILLEKLSIDHIVLDMTLSIQHLELLPLPLFSILHGLLNLEPHSLLHSMH